MKHTLLAFASLIACPLFAQPTFNEADFPTNIGPTPGIYITNYVAPGPATANFTYDATGATLNTVSYGQVMLAGSSPYGVSYPQAEYASTALTNPQQYGYFSSSPTAQTNYGYYGPTSHVILTNGENLFQFPLSMGSTWSDAWNGTGSNSGQTFTRSGNTSGNYNGYGTIQLPFGTFTNVARVELTEIYGDVFTGSSIDYEIYLVNYVKQGLETTLFTTAVLMYDFGLGMDTLTTYSTVIDPLAIGMGEYNTAEIEAAVYPNPASGAATIVLGDEVASRVSATLLDATGREVRAMGTSNGLGQRIDLDLNGVLPGMYFVRLADEAGRVRSLPLQVY